MIVEAIDLKRMVAARIRARRLAMGMTQKQLADALGTHSPYVTALEMCRKSPNLETIAKLSKALQVSPSYWLETELAAMPEKISA